MAAIPVDGYGYEDEWDPWDGWPSEAPIEDEGYAYDYDDPIGVAGLGETSIG